MRRAKIFSWTLTGMLIVFLMLLLVQGNIYILISLLVIIIGEIIFTRIEAKRIFKRVNNYFSNNNYLEAIEYLNCIYEKCYILGNAYNCIITIVVCHMYLGDTTKAKDLLDKYDRIKNTKNLFYIQMVILLSENKITEAKKFYQKILDLNSKKTKALKDASIKIFNMIETKVFDEELYNNTSYPLLKEFCLRYKNDTMDNIEINSEKQVSLLTNDQIIQSHKIKYNVRFYSFLLNLFTVLTLFAGLIIAVIYSNSHNTISSMEGLYYFIQSIWVFWLFLPLSIGCIIYGILFKVKKYKTTSNIVFGIIISILLFGLGSIHFLGKKEFKTDSEYLDNLSETINVDFPENITIITQDSTTGTQTSSDNIYYKYVSVVRFHDDNELLIFEDNINDLYWIDSFTGKSMNFLPMIFTIETIDYNKYLLYCYETNEYNPEAGISKNSYIAIAYSWENRSLIIYEFSIK